MTNEELIESGFLLALMYQYTEYHVSYGSQDKDRLMYVLCSSEEEKEQKTRLKIEEFKNEILIKGFEELSFAYMQKIRFKDHFKNETENWEKIFVNAFISEEIEIFDLTVKASIIENSKDTSENEDLLTEIHQTYDNIEQILAYESELLEAISNDIQQFNETDDWKIDIDYYKQYRNDIHGFDIFFNLCELLVLLNRLEMFESFLTIDDEYTPIPKKQLVNNSFKKYLIGTEEEKNKILEFLTQNYKGEVGKTIALMIQGLEANKLLTYPSRTQLYNSLRFSWGDIGTDSSINKFYKSEKLRTDELSEAINLHAEKIKINIENLPK